MRALLAFAGVAPFVPSWTESVPVLAPLGGALDAWFSFHCHRDAERMLVSSAVCTRCLGIYVGLALGALVAKPHLSPARRVAWLAAAAAALVIDVVTESLGWRPPFAPLRFVTGAALAYPAALSMVRALAGGRIETRASGT